MTLLFFFVFPLCAFPSNFSLDSLTTKQVWIASHILPGSGQIVNKQYWKVPVFYAGMGSMAYLGVEANNRYNKTFNQFLEFEPGSEQSMLAKIQYTEYKAQRNFFYTGVALFYIASVADAVVVHTKEDHSPTTATVLSMLMPGLGQIYNQKLWKVPVILGGAASLAYMVDFNQRGYNRFGNAYREFPEDEFDGNRSRDELKLLRDAYRRNRDLSVISLVALYALNIIDANVDAHLFDWDISDNLALSVEPVIYGEPSPYGSIAAFQPVMGLSFKCSIK